MYSKEAFCQVQSIGVGFSSTHVIRFRKHMGINQNKRTYRKKLDLDRAVVSRTKKGSIDNFNPLHEGGKVLHWRGPKTVNLCHVGSPHRLRCPVYDVPRSLPLRYRAVIQALDPYAVCLTNAGKHRKTVNTADAKTYGFEKVVWRPVFGIHIPPLRTVSV